MTSYLYAHKVRIFAIRISRHHSAMNCGRTQNVWRWKTESKSNISAKGMCAQRIWWKLCAEEVALVRTQAQTESHLAVEVPSARSAPLQPPDRPCLSPQRRFSAVLGIQLAHLGRHVPGFLVLSNHAQPYRADEGRSPAPCAPTAPCCSTTSRPGNSFPAASSRG
jgi:hypothetical protein